MFSEEQKVTLVVLSWLAATVSVISSSMIVYVLISDKTEKKQHPFRRLMLGACFMDILFSGSMMLFGGWAIPREPWTTDLFAVGNQISCNLSGFLTITGNGGQLLYSAAFSIYHLAIVRFRASIEKVEKVLEPTLHIVSFLVPVGFAALELFIGYINPSPFNPGICHLATNPPNCLDYPNIECVRGDSWMQAHKIASIIYSLAFISCWIIMIVAYLLMWLTVRSTERRMRQYGFRSSQAANFVNTKKVGIQGMLYVGCFTLSNIFLVVGVTILVPFFETADKNRSLYFGLQVLSLPLAQLQGFFHAIIYFRPRWHNLIEPGRAFSCLKKKRRTVDVQDSASVHVSKESPESPDEDKTSSRDHFESGVEP